MTKIVYIAGWGRSGTTLLDNLLGQVDGFVSTGELHHVWKRGLIDGRDCGCGKRVRDCEFWIGAFEAGFGGIDQIDPAAAIEAARSVKTRYARRVLRMKQAGTLLDRCEYAPVMKRLYDGVATSSGARVIVDSSKYPVDAIAAAGLSGYEVYVVHMVRDPRAVAFSWQRFKPVLDKTVDGGLLRRVGLVRSTLVWQVYNLVIARHVRAAVGPDRYLRLPYERLAADPESVLAEVLSLAGEAAAAGPTFDGNTVLVAPTHTASGNPSRFASGPTRIRLDSEWKRAMSGRRRLAVSLLSFPTLRIMGYRWFS